MPHVLVQTLVGEARTGGRFMNVAEDILVARAYLSRVAEAGSMAMAAFVEDHGPVECARLIRAGDVPATVAAVTDARRASADGEADLAAAERHRIRFVVPESVEWPHFALAPLYAAQARRRLAYASGARTARYGGEPTVPLGLWVDGSLPVAELGVRSVALVGARAATSYGEHCAAEFAYGLARAEITVVSGGAFGIDASAHRGALAADGPTVLVSAGGLDRPYPNAHRNLFDRVRETGLLVSESPPGAAPQKHRFLSRNRIIAALSSGTVVVEAAPRSGALNTAAHCVSLGRPLMAVPGPVTSAVSAGCHALIRRDDNAALLVTSTADILSVIGPVGVRPEAAAWPDGDGRTGDGASGTRRPHDDLDPSARAVLDGVPGRGWITENGLALSSAIPVPEIMRALPMLHLAGLVEFGPEGVRLCRGVVR